MALLANLAPQQLKGITILSLVYLANAAGKTDYRAAHRQLVSDAVSFFGGTSIVSDVDSSYNLLLIEAVVAWQGAYDSDATLSTSVNTLLNLAGHLKDLPIDTQDRVIFFLQNMLAY